MTQNFLKRPKHQNKKFLKKKWMDYDINAKRAPKKCCRITNSINVTHAHIEPPPPISCRRVVSEKNCPGWWNLFFMRHDSVRISKFRKKEIS